MEEKDIDQSSTDTIADLAVSLSMEHSALSIAAVHQRSKHEYLQNCVKSESDYDKMCETIFDLRHEIQTFEPVWEEEGGTVH